MSSVSSFVCLSSNFGDISQSDFSFIQNPTNESSAIDINENENENGTATRIDDFEHLSQNEEIYIPAKSVTNDNNFEHVTSNETEEEYDNISNHNFDVQSVHSIDTVKHFVFGDFNFNNMQIRNTDNKSNKSPSKWIWSGNLSKKRKLKHRRKKNRLDLSLCIIDENGEMQTEESYDNKTVVNVKDLNDFINDTIQINDNISDIIFLCNKICKTGMLNVNNIEIELHEIPLIGLKLRDIFFRKLVLLNDEIESQQKHLFRREYWLRLSWHSRVFLTPFGSFEEFRDLYNVHKSVKSTEFLSVLNAESFDILMRPEWIRVCLFQSYVTRIKNLNYMKRINIEQEQMNEIRSVLHIGDFNDELANLQRFKHKQLSLIMSDNYSRHESEFTDSFEAFDALERQIQTQIRFEVELMDTYTATDITYAS